jgi:LPS-assembly lipoprotein
MWSSRLIVAVLAALLLHGCGFRPLYGNSGDGDRVSRALAQIRVETIADRTGQKLRNFLLDRLNPAGQPSQPLYSLRVTTSVSRTDLGIQRDETATRAVLVLTAQFNLLDAAGKTVLVEGSMQSTNGLNILDSDFATLSSETDAIDRAAREVSDDIRTRLALYFSGGKS